MTINAMTVTAGDAARVLRTGWDVQNSHGMRFSYMLHGRPGIGKTQIVEQLARYMGGRLYDIRLTQIEVSDLRGLPYYNHETRTTEWYRPQDLPADTEPAVLFLDEITAAEPHLLPTVYGLLQERRVGVHKIPDNVIIVAAGNTVDDGAVAYEMTTAVANRLVHMHVQADAEDWLRNYAVPNNLHPTVSAFIRARPELLETSVECQRAQKLVAATPRSWDRVSQIMNAVSDRRIRQIMIAGTVGDSVCADFLIVAEDVAAVSQVVEMVRTPRAERSRMFPTHQYGLWAVVFGLLGLVKEENADAVVEILVDLGNLAALRPDARSDLERMPLAEMRAHGMEILLGKLIDLGLNEIVLKNQAYNEYDNERVELGLATSAARH